MATGTSPSTAEEACVHPTDENANFLRLTRLLMRGGLQLLRDTFNGIHSPANLPTVLGNCTTKKTLQTLKPNKVLTQTQCMEVPLRPTWTRNLWKVDRF